jgi:hypothetical protein
MHATLGKAKEIFVAAFRLAPDQSDGYLAEACGGNDELRRRVKELLLANVEAGSFLEPAASPQSLARQPHLGRRPRSNGLDVALADLLAARPQCGEFPEPAPAPLPTRVCRPASVASKSLCFLLLLNPSGRYYAANQIPSMLVQSMELR